MCKLSKINLHKTKNYFTIIYIIGHQPNQYETKQDISATENDITKDVSI